jgi:hypothetical protein
MKYQIFARSFYDGQGKPKIGRKTILWYVDTIEEARRICAKFNDGPRTPTQVRKGYKYEFTSNY